MARIFQGISLLFLINFLSFTAHAADLQAFIQEGETTTTTEKVAMPDSVANNPLKDIQTTNANEQFTHIIELVVAGIVASALIISVLVLFLGRWAGRREKKIIKKIRLKAEEEQENIIASAATVREQEKETTQIVHKIRDDAKEFSAKKEVIENFDNDVHEITLQVKAKKAVIDEISDTVNENIGKIKTYWDEQLTSTITTIEKVQGGLDKSLSSVDKNLDDMLQQKIQSDELLGEFIAKNNEQLNIVKENSVSSDELNKNLKETLKESTQLLKLLKKHQKSADKSLNKFTEELIAYEEQAYEQFDTSFQVADLARQELNANIDESRKHIETMRRHEEQSHSINTQTQKNLKSLNFTKIAKLSHTLDSTFSMFTDMTDKVDETRAMLDELNDLKADISNTKPADIKTLIAKPNNKPLLAKKIKIEVQQTEPKQTRQTSPQSSPVKVDLKKPTIDAKVTQKVEVIQKTVTTNNTVAPIKDIITTNKDHIKTIKPSLNKGLSAKNEPSADESSLIAKKLAAIKKTARPKENPLARKMPLTTPITKVKNTSTISNKTPKKQTLKEQATTLKKDTLETTKNHKLKNITPKSKPIIIKSKGTAKPIKEKISTPKPIIQTKEHSITNAIEDQVEIKSVLNSSEASKSAFKMANTDNVPVSFFTNVKKKNPTKKVEKKEPILGSVKRSLFGGK